MRTNLAALKQPFHSYEKLEHNELFKNLRIARRDHYHFREGYKDNMPFIALIKVDLSSPNKSVWGHIAGPDDNHLRKCSLLDIEFELEIDHMGNIDISINSTDGTTSYSESIILVHYCLNEMSRKSIELTRNDSGGGPGKKGFYVQSAEKKGRFSTFDKTFQKAEDELILPPTFKDSLIRANYNLIHYKG